MGYAQYSFQYRCDEDQKICLGDGTEKLFFNCASDSENIPENLREIFDYIRVGKVSGDLTRKIDEAVQKAHRETLIKAFPPPDLRCEAAISLANPCDPPEALRKC